MSSIRGVEVAGLVELVDRAETDLPGFLAVAEAVLRRAGSLPLGGAVADGVLTGLVQRYEALVGMCQGQKLAVVAEIAERQAHRGYGAASTQDLLARTLRLSPGEARAQAELAEGLAAIPETAQALRDGRIGVGQASVTVKKAQELAGIAAGPDAPAGAQETARELIGELDAHAASEGQLVDRGRLGRQLDALTQQRGVDVLASREQRAAKRRGVWFSEREGLPTLQANLTVEGQAVLQAALGAAARPDGSHDDRELPQRLHDALVDLVGQKLDAGVLPQVATQRPHVLLITTPESLHGVEGAQPSLLDGVGPVSTELARQVCCDAEITQVVTDRNGKILDVGRDQRLPSRPQRVAVIARDRACVGCGANVTRCQVHHIRWWGRDRGPTDLDNLVLVCWNCHRHIHHHQWDVWRDQQGRYHTGPPAERDGHSGRSTGGTSGTAPGDEQRHRRTA